MLVVSLIFFLISLTYLMLTYKKVDNFLKETQANLDHIEKANKQIEEVSNMLDTLDIRPHVEQTVVEVVLRTVFREEPRHIHTLISTMWVSDEPLKKYRLFLSNAIKDEVFKVLPIQLDGTKEEILDRLEDTLKIHHKRDSRVPEFYIDGRGYRWTENAIWYNLDITTVVTKQLSAPPTHIVKIPVYIDPYKEPQTGFSLPEEKDIKIVEQILSSKQKAYKDRETN